jgi:hypothetical protein
MTTFEDLPAELQQGIIKHLPKKALVQCQITSRQWYNGSTIALYNGIVIDQDKSLNKLIQTIEENPSALYIASIKLVCCYKYAIPWDNS